MNTSKPPSGHVELPAPGFSHLKRILHPTDLARDSQGAFLHALKLAVAARAELDILHIESHPNPSDLTRFPSVRKTLIDWGILPHGASQQDVAKLGITVRKLCLQDSNPEAGILHYLADHNEDLIVLSTHQRHGIDRWFHPEIATRVALRSHAATLFIPAGNQGFVSAETGKSSLQRIVIPVASIPSPQTALNLTAELLRAIGPSAGSPELTMMHVGPQPMTQPDIRYPQDSNWNWNWLARGEDVVDDILDVAEQKSADLIAMTTQGHTCWKDVLAGCTTENVIHDAPCAVLAVHAFEPDAMSRSLRTA
ncbi:MAG: universal stress protein [Planctomycetota bacterium]|jgi:nucleotide-binding universal stress UspA family protein